MKSMTSKVSQLMSSNSSLQKELLKVKQENEVLHALLMNQQQNDASPATQPSRSQLQQHLHSSLFY